MNKKLFALLASAALMASFAPSVFAEANEEPAEATESAADTAVVSDVTAALEIKAPATAEAGKDVTFDVYFTSSIQLTGFQFNFTADKGEITGFTFDEDTIKDLGFDDYEFTLEASDEFKALGNDDYQVMAVDTDFKDATVPANTKIGTLTVKAGEVGDVITINTKGNLANYDYGDAEAAWTTTPASVTVSEATESEPESAAAPESSSNSEVSSSNSEVSSSNSESSKATTNTSSKATNGTTNNTNTGAASTAAVALAASAAALVVISKKRK